MSKKTQEKYKLAGLCAQCGRVPPRSDKPTCETCNEKSKQNARTRANANIAKGLCSKCGVNKLVTKRHCDQCYSKHKSSARKNYLILRDAVFNAYGGYKCTCCGEKQQAFLTIDHVNNNGCEHRRQIGQSNCYRWLKQNDYPSGFQVLCMNCQWGRKNCGGVCPHQQNQKTS